MKRIAIIGGGISGLSAAFTLEQQRRAGVPLEYVVFEASSRLGGVILTERIEGCLVEAGPDSFLTEKPWAADLCRELGIEDQLIGSNDKRRKTYISVDGKLIAIPQELAFMIPTSIPPIAASELFSLQTKFRMAMEWFHSKSEVDADESVATFVDRHYGRQMVDRIADPMLSAIYGGEASELSVRAVLPRFVEMQKEYGSLSKATKMSRKEKVSFGIDETKRPIFTSLKDGMRQLTDAILRELPATSVYVDSQVGSLRRRKKGDEDAWLVSWNGKSQVFDSVIVAVPTHAAAGMIDEVDPDLSRELRDIPYSSSVIVALGLDEPVRKQLPDGFGYLVPRNEGKRVLAATFVHNKFENRVPEGRALIRCFLGGTRDGQVLQLLDNEILAIVLSELWETLGISGDPLFSRVYRWKQSMPQYTIGYLERIKRIEGMVDRLPSIFLAGNAYGGIGIPDCVRSGKDAANRP